MTSSDVSALALSTAVYKLSSIFPCRGEKRGEDIRKVGCIDKRYNSRRASIFR